MQKMNIPILGLTSNSEARAVRDGESMVLHNLTVEQGGTRVIVPPIVEGGSQKEYYHEKAGQWLSIVNGAVVDSKGNLINTLDGVCDGVITSMSFMGNVVVMYSEDNAVRYAIFDGYYRYLGRLPEIPELDITIEPDQVTILTENKYYVKDLDDNESAENRALQWKNNSKGFFDRCLRGLYQKGAFVDRTMIRIAARLFDGSYVSYSPIYYVEDSDELIDVLSYENGVKTKIGRDDMNFVSRPKYLGGRKSLFYVSVRGFIPSLKLVAASLSRWRDVIVGFDVFASPSIMGHENDNNQVEEKSRYIKANTSVENVNVELSAVTEFDRYVPKSAAKIRTDVSEMSSFYKIAEFDVYGSMVWKVEDTSPSQLAVQKSLPVNECPHDISGGYNYIYNNKLHLAGVNERFADAYNYFKKVGTEGSAHQITSVVDIVADDKVKRVVATDKAPFVDIENITPLLHYPDARAKSMTVYVSFGSSVKKKTFNLTSHIAMNEAYYLNDAVESVYNSSPEINTEQFISALQPDIRYQKDYSGSYTFTKSGDTWSLGAILDDGTGAAVENITPEDYGVESGEEESITVRIEKSGIAGIASINANEWENVGSDEIVLSADGTFTLKEIAEDRNYTRNGVMRVSEVDNPFFFPARFTYSFDADIVAVCSNTIALSQGQFGQHPLYVFTKSGIWMMTVDSSGEGSYLSQVPVSREICTNGDGVSATVGGVVFPTAKGLMLISGAEAVDISQAIAGLETQELVVEDGIEKRICDVVGKGGVLLRGGFIGYLDNAFTAYDYYTGLLYVCNKEFDYSYAYNMRSGAWSTVDGSYDARLPYPGELVLSGSVNGTYKRYRFSRFDSLVNDVPVAMVSRGCFFGETGFKRVGECALRATLYGDRMGFYVLGSVDGVSWVLIGGREVKNGARAAEPVRALVRDLVTRFKRSRSFRFVKFAFVGRVRSDAKLLMCEAMVEGAWGNRIR